MIVSSSLWNLVSLINMSSHHLRKNEVEYELKIRGVSHVGNANDLRKRLNECNSLNTPVSDEAVGELNPEEEIEVCEEKYVDLESLVTDYEGSGKDNEFNRVLARLWHLNLRIGRIPVKENQPDDRLTELKGKGKILLDGFIALGETAKTASAEDGKKTEEIGVQMDNLAEASNAQPSSTINTPTKVSTSTSNVISGPAIVSTVTSSGSPRLSTTSSAATPTCDTSPPNNITTTLLAATDTRHPSATGASFKIDNSRHHVPVFKWGLQFEYSSNQSIGSFLQRVEELRRARGVSEEELFESAVDLFKGTTLVWYRSTLGRIKSWRELCEELRTVFQSPDYDFRLQREIINRFQGPDEPIDLYIASLEGLFGRLTTPVGEESRLRQLMDNMNPHLQDRLALEEIRTIEELRSKGRRAESGRLRAAFVREPVVHRQVLEPDLAYHEKKRRGNPPVGNLASISTSSLGKSPVKGDRRCWNCGDEGHVFSNCKKERKKFCYGCGLPEVIKIKCVRCNPKNE